jgi:uncharacterized protein
MSALLDQFGNELPTRLPFLDSIQNQQTGMGVPGYDPAIQLRYTPTHFLTQCEAENAFLNSFIIGRFIELPAQHMTREWRRPKIDGGTSDEIEAIETVEWNLDVKTSIAEAQMWGDLYGGALIILGLDGDLLEEPLDVENIRQGQLTSLTVVDRWQVQPAMTYIFDPLDANFRMPEYYEFTLPSGFQRVHASRCLRFDGCRLPRLAWLRNGRWHGSTVQRVLDAIIQFEAAIRASSKAMQEGSVDVYQIENLYQSLMDTNAQTRIWNRVKWAADLKSIYRAIIIDKTDGLQRVPIDVRGYDTLLEKHQAIVCGATEMPATLLFGRSPAGLNATGESDFRNWYDTLSMKQEFKLRPILNQLDEVLVRSALGYMPDEYSFDFNPLWQISADQESQINLRKAQARQIYIDKGAMLPETVAADIMAEGFSQNMTQDDVDEIEAVGAPMPLRPGVNQAALIRSMSAAPNAPPATEE